MSKDISYQDFIKMLVGMTGFTTAALTDEYIVDRWPMKYSTLSGKEDKILEIRVFNDKKEYKLFRTDIGKPFSFRMIDDDDLEKGISRIEEYQYLDIDTRRSTGGNKPVHTTGGGTFYLPVDKMENAKVKIINYIKKDERSGEARVSDWRAAGILEV